MATNDEQGEDKSGKGFAGLSSMVSDVEAAVTKAEHAKLEPSASSSAAARTRAAPHEPEAGQQPYQQSAQTPSGGSSAGKWMLGIGALFGFIWLMSESGTKSPAPVPTYTPSSPPSVNRPSEPARQSSPAPVQPRTPTRPTEEQPPVGTSNVLGAAQLRYCLAEDIRLEAAKGALNNYIDSDVNRFNAMVADYNSRCGQFRYRRGSLETARSEIEAFRSLLQSEGQSRFHTKAKPSSQDPTSNTNLGRQRIPKSNSIPLQPKSEAAQSDKPKREQPPSTGIRCTYSSECAGFNQCLDGQCRPSRTAGERCS